MHTLVFVLMKITGWPLGLIFFKWRTYFENRSNQKIKVKGGALLVSNHKSFWDYITLFFIFFRYKVRPVVSHLIYHKNPVLKFCLNCVNAIVVGKDMLDTSYMNEVKSLLLKGKKIVIFPEGHFSHTDDLLPFAPSYIKIAYDADVPIIPIYTDGRYGLFKRNHVMIGTRHYVRSMIDTELTKDKIEELNTYFVKNIGELRRKMLVRKKNPTLHIKNFFMDLGRIWLYTHFSPIFRVHIHDTAKEYHYHKLDGPVLIASNHHGFSDPVVLLQAFNRRRVHFVTAKEVFLNHRLREKMLKGLGAVPIDRDIFDIEAISKSVDILNRGRCLLIFPEGHIANNEEGQDAFKNGAMMIASRSKSPIIPIYICKAKHWYSTRHIYTGELIAPPSLSMKSLSLASKMLEERIEELHQLAIKEGRCHE